MFSERPGRARWKGRTCGGNGAERDGELGAEYSLSVLPRSCWSDSRPKLVTENFAS